MRLRWRRHGLALVALALWLPTAGALAWLLLRGEPSTAPSDDPRQVVTASVADARIISEVMRDNLRHYQQLLDAAARDDMAEVARLAAAAAEVPGPARRSPTLDSSLPRQWRLMGQQVHQGLRDLSAAAQQPDGTDQVATHLRDITAACLACHDTYRLVVAE